MTLDLLRSDDDKSMMMVINFLLVRLCNDNILNYFFFAIRSI